MGLVLVILALSDLEDSFTPRNPLCRDLGQHQLVQLGPWEHNVLVTTPNEKLIACQCATYDEVESGE